MNIKNLKKALEDALLITDWSPTEADLNKIARRMASLSSSASKNDIEQIIHDVIGPYEDIAMEGLDNSDLTTLLRLATKVTK